MPDAADEQIRALVARAVAQAPPAPSVSDVGTPTIAAADPERRVHRSGGKRAVLTVAASVLALALVMAGALAVGELGGAPDQADRAGAPGDGSRVRFVPTDVPPGMRLTNVDSDSGSDPVALPLVSVFEDARGVVVRVVVDPEAAAAAGAGTTETTTSPGTASPGTTPSGPSSTTVPPTSTTIPATTTPPEATTPGGASTTTTVLASGSPVLPDRNGIEATEVRGAPGGVEVHDATTTTVWFQHQGVVVAVDVFGLDRAGALGIVDRLLPRPGGGFDPAPQDDLVSVAEVAAGSTDAPPPTTRLVYTPADSTGGPAFIVTTVELGPRRDELLTAAADSFGRLERWGDREVLVDDHHDGGTSASASFLDPAGVLVSVEAPAGDELRSYVDGLEPVSDRAWEWFLADHADGLNITDTTVK